MTFQIRGLDPAPFANLFALRDAELAAIGACRVLADEPDAYPCRVSLKRVEAGEELLLVNYAHLSDAASPYRAAGPIFVSRAVEAGYYAGELPPILRGRLLSLRVYDAKALIVDADVVEGEEVVPLIERFLSDSNAAHVDVHFARRGCFAARIERA